MTDKHYFQVLDVTIDSGKLNEETMKKYLDQMKPKSGYCLCPGVETTYRSLKNSIFRDPTYLRKWPDGTRYDHVDCELWYNPKLMSDKLTKTRCYRCHVVLQSLNHAVKNSKLAEKSCTGTLPKSHTLTYMTPEMRRRTLQRRSEEIRKLRQKVDKYQKYINSLQGKGLISKETDEIMTDIQGPPAINGASCQTAGEICSGTNRNISKLSPDTNTNLSSNSGTCCDYSNISIHSEESSFGGSKRTEDLGLEMSVDSETMNSENDYYTSTDEEDFRTEIDTCIDNNPTDSENILKLYSINNT